MPDIFATAVVRPSLLLRRMRAHREVSEGSRTVLTATRTILGHRCYFYRNGLRHVDGLDLDEQQAHDSELLRFAHASLLTGVPCGDQRRLYVDATHDPVEVWLYGHRIHQPSDLRRLAHDGDVRLP